VPWDIAALSRRPETYAAEGVGANVDGVEAIFYDGVPYRGKPTRVFAYLALPKLAPGERAPGIVLVHGGAGTAFPDWAKLWADRGYAAIAMDTCGCVHADLPPDKAYVGPWPRHEHAGPPGWGGFDQMEEPLEDQWMYHAVADVLLGRSLLASLPQVDPGRVGLTGVSWGGILACTAAGVDSRFAFAVPVYGCGFLDAWIRKKENFSPDHRHRWCELWDPKHYLPGAKLPMLWLNGTNDLAFPLTWTQASYRLAPGERTLSIRIGLVHGHGGPGEKPEEIRAFADWRCRGGPPLTEVLAQGLDGRRAWATFAADVPVVRAELNYAADANPNWLEREWQTAPATIEPSGDLATAELPDGATAWFINLTDKRGLVASSQHVTRED